MLSAQFFISVVVILVVLHTMLLATAYLILLERKVAAWTQDRIGPNRTNFSFGQGDLLEKIPGLSLLSTTKCLGLGQALADGIKLFVKEDYTPPFVDRRLFYLGPMLAVGLAMLGWAVIPWGGTMVFGGIPSVAPLTTWFPEMLYLVEPGVARVAVLPVSIGVIYILAISSLAVYGVVLGAYASNNKFSFLGGLRATAQMLSYEIPMGTILLMMLLWYGSADTEVIARSQQTVAQPWGVFVHPILACLFFTCILAECNRAPFDLAEAEQELVGGFHTEYSSMKWALFFLGEYLHMITGSAFFVLLFLGGWSLPFFPLPEVAGVLGGGGFGEVLATLGLVLLKFGIYAFKVFLCLFVMMWVRWTLPRFRFDQLMRLAWQGMIPFTLISLMVVGVLVYLGVEFWPIYTVAELITAAIVLLVSQKLLPEGPKVNRKIPLEGSRFSPA